MSSLRSKAIVAVFGGDDAEAITLAKQFGAALCSKGILLTGGTGPGNDSVKNNAIAGVGTSPWIGVDRSGTIGSREHNNGFVIDTDLGHKRNFLEAHLCDAAIGLAGGDGTISEITFALSLQRPVALVGEQWKRERLLAGPNNVPVIAEMLRRSFNRVRHEPSGRQDLDALLSEPTIRGNLAQLPPCKHFASATDPADIIDWVLLSVSKKAGRFPELKGYETVIAEYDRWLTRYAA